MKYILFITLVLCNIAILSAKDINKDEFIYKLILSNIDDGLDIEAQNNLLQLLSKYPKSSFIKPSLFLMIDYYLDKEEYREAKFYLKRVKEKFVNLNNKDYLDYLEVFIQYSKIDKINRNQQQITSIMENLQDFLDLYPNNKYYYKVSTMYAHLYLSNILNNKNIAKLYDSLGKQEASLFYQQKDDDIDMSHIVAPDSNFFEKIF
jgi:outer membrane protein assembly factor BamD (BamD/ComL family)